jgi:carbonic anhydrase
MVLQLTDGTCTTDALHTVLSHVSEIPETGRTTILHDLNMEAIVNTINSSEFYYYIGSLTTPPCSEDVVFLLAKDPFPIGFKQYNDLKAVVGMNARHVQGPQDTENIIVTAARNLAKEEPALLSN